MNVPESELERMIKEDIAKELSYIEVPDVKEQWAKIQKQIMDNNTPPIKEKRIKLYKRLAWIAAVLVLTSSITAYKPIYAQAFGDKFIQLYNLIVGKTTRNRTESYQHTTQTAVPSVQDLGPTAEKEVSLQEAQSMVPYQLALPKYLPEGTKQLKVLLSSIGDNAQKVTIQYNYAGNIMVLEQRNSGRAASRGSLYDTDDTKITDITVNGAPATLMENKSGLCTLDWELRGLLLQLSGKVPADEIKKVADSIN